MGIFVSWIYFWPEAKFISLATVHARLAPERLSWDDWTRMAHNHRDRQAKGILSRRLHEKAQIGARGPTSQRIPRLLSSTHTQATKLHSLVENPKLQKKQNKLYPYKYNFAFKIRQEQNNDSRTKKQIGAAATRGNPYEETRRRCTTQDNYNYTTIISHKSLLSISYLYVVYFFKKYLPPQRYQLRIR